MDIPNQVLGVRLLVALARGRVGVGGEGSLVVEAVQIAAGVLELFDPTFRLGNHHVAVKGAASMRGGGLLDVRADLGDDGGTEGDVGNEVAVPGWVDLGH